MSAPAPANKREREKSQTYRITSEEMDIVLHPLQRKPLIVQPRVRDTVRPHRRSGEPAEGAESVVQGDVDDAVAAVGHAAGEEAGRAAGAGFGAEGVASVFILLLS